MYLCFCCQCLPLCTNKKTPDQTKGQTARPCAQICPNREGSHIHLLSIFLSLLLHSLLPLPPSFKTTPRKKSKHLRRHSFELFTNSPSLSTMTNPVEQTVPTQEQGQDQNQQRQQKQEQPSSVDTTTTSTHPESVSSEPLPENTPDDQVYSIKLIGHIKGVPHHR